MNKNRLWNICLDIYQESFAKAKPKMDFMKQYMLDASKIDYAKHYLPGNDFDGIVEKHLKKNELSASESSAVRQTVYLGAAPTSKKPKKMQSKKVPKHAR